MKQSRRHELKTNELKLHLQQMYASAVRNANYLIGGVVVAVLILLLALYIQNRRHNARETAWDQLNDLQRTNVSEKPEAVEQAAKLAAEHHGDKQLGPLAAMLHADLSYSLAMSLDPAKERDRYLKLLRDARDRYREVAQQYGDTDQRVAAQARLSLAAVEESLLVAGEESKEAVRQPYEALVKSGTPLYKDLAGEMLASLDERTQPLKLVATRPAETPTTAPATGPAATQPIISTRPATTPAETQPAGQ